jgi:predicted oxidoreductase
MGYHSLGRSLHRSYLPAYMKKKGENLATKEDLKDLVTQMSAITQVTKDIEAKISDKVWDRQRQWEMKRDAIVGAVQALGRAKDGLLQLASVYILANKHGHEAWAQRVGETKMAWSDLITTYDEKRFGAELVCSKELSTAMSVAGVEIRTTAKKIWTENIDDYGVLSKPVIEKIAKVLALARSELGISSAH